MSASTQAASRPGRRPALQRATQQTTLLRDVDAFARFSVLEEGGGCLNLFLFLGAIYSGLSVVRHANGSAAIDYKGDKGHSMRYFVPLSLTLLPPESEGGVSGGLISEPEAIELMVATIRCTGPSAFAYAWTRRALPVFEHAVASTAVLMAIVPWQFASVFRIGRSDLWEAASVMLLQVVASVASPSRLCALSTHIFPTGGWRLDLATADKLADLRDAYAIRAVATSPANCRLSICGVPLFIAQRDWAFLALYLLVHGRDMARAIPELDRPLALTRSLDPPP